MIVADTYLGKRDDPTIAARLDEIDPVHIQIDGTERRRSRFRTTAEGGQDVGVVISRDLDEGDVLDADGTLVVVELEPIEALVLDFSEVDISPMTALETGHAVGNRHWNLAVREDEVLLPVTDDRARMEAAVGPLLDEGAELNYATVTPTTFDDGYGEAHSGHGHGESHAHGHANGHGHFHGDGHSSDCDHVHDHGPDSHRHREESNEAETDQAPMSEPRE